MCLLLWMKAMCVCRFMMSDVCINDENVPQSAVWCVCVCMCASGELRRCAGLLKKTGASLFSDELSRERHHDFNVRFFETENGWLQIPLCLQPSKITDVTLTDLGYCVFPFCSALCSQRRLCGFSSLFIFDFDKLIFLFIFYTNDHATTTTNKP